MAEHCNAKVVVVDMRALFLQLYIIDVFDWGRASYLSHAGGHYHCRQHFKLIASSLTGHGAFAIAGVKDGHEPYHPYRVSDSLEFPIFHKVSNQSQQNHQIA